MTQVIQTVRRFERRFDESTVHLMERHPLLVFLATFIGMPLAVLLAVFALTAFVMVPVSWLCGWL